MKTVCVTFIVLTSAIAAGQPNADQIVARMMQRDQARRMSLGSYTWTSHYVVDNKDRHAEMTVRWTRQSDGRRNFEIVSEEGDGGIRGHVFRRLLDSEVEASQPAHQERNRLNTRNYSFELAGTDTIRGRLTYVLAIEPRAEAKFLTKGRIWVDAVDFAVVQVEGSPSKRPSFWTNTVIYVQTYKKSGDLWLAESNRSVTEAKIFGKAEMLIQHFDYRFPQTLASSRD